MADEFGYTLMAEKTENDIKETEKTKGADDKSSMRWYVLHTTPGHEKMVINSLRERLCESPLSSKFGDILVPTEEVVEIRSGAKRKSARKFFPGYILVQMEMDDQTWHLARYVPKVRGFIGGEPHHPAPISEEESERILQRMRDSEFDPKPKILFEPGEMVRVTDGPFNDFNAIVEEVFYDKSKVQVSVQIFGRSTPVELDFTQVGKA